MNRKRLLGSTAILFVIFESIMFYQIHIEMSDTDNKLRYACIIAATIFSWLTLIIELVTARSEGKKISDILFSLSNGNLIRIAMIFTLVADYYMVALDVADNLTGVTVFLGTQLFIFLHILLNDESKKSRAANVILHILLTIIAIFIAYAILGDDADRLAVISVIYYANLCVNAIFAHRIGRGGVILTIGLILFALCDINVGLSGLNSIYADGFTEGSLLYTLTHTDVDLIWGFYIPSQTLIPITLLINENKDN